MNYQKKLENKTKCLICPRECLISNGQKGFCHVRENLNGEIVLTTYGYNTGLSLDPIEKKPLYHFYPNTSILSFGTIGCNMGCLFCQNYQTTKNKSDPKSFYKASPEEIIGAAKKYNIKSIAFTYNEPVIFFEYARDCAKLAKEEGIKTVLVSAGYINEAPRKELFQYIDAMNIDLKGFSEEFYNKNCGAKLAPVLDTIKYVKSETNCHLELTTMIIEGKNNSYDTLKAETDWILNNLGADIPLHFSAFFPRYKYANMAQTSFEALLKARNTALEGGLNYVYTGNLSNIETSSTFCKKCKKPLIVRGGYNIIEYNLADNKCKFCEEEIYGEY